MDTPKYTTLLAALQAVPDPRKARGKRHTWPVILTLIVAALASGQKNVRAIAQWGVLHAAEILDLLGLNSPSPPSASTVYRALRAIDIGALEARLAQYNQELPPPSNAETGEVTLRTGETVQGQAVDGKEVRGASAHGKKVKLVSLVTHGSGRTLAQTHVAVGKGEATTAPGLLLGRELRGTVTTMDAGLTKRPLAQQIIDQHGHYLIVVKRNQRDLYDAIALVFDQPAALRWLPREKAENYRCYHSHNKGHGRLEKRTLESTPYLNEYLAWPGLGQVMRRTCQRVHLKTGEVSREITYGLTSLGWDEADAKHLEHLWRAHWTIENRSHYVRDETLGEDRCQVWVGAAPQALAAIRNSLITLLRHKGWTNIADALRHYGASVHSVLTLLDAVPVRL
jgi:predicted transposase YbfD/YdcC